MPHLGIGYTKKDIYNLETFINRNTHYINYDMYTLNSSTQRDDILYTLRHVYS